MIKPTVTLRSSQEQRLTFRPLEVTLTLFKGLLIETAAGEVQSLLPWETHIRNQHYNWNTEAEKYPGVSGFLGFLSEVGIAMASSQSILHKTKDKVEVRV